MSVPFSDVTDYLSLGTTYECFRSAQPENVELTKIKAASGTHLQEDARIKVITVNCDYYMRSGATKLAAGSTQNGYLVDSCEVKQGDSEHKTMTVAAHKHEAVAVTSNL